MPCKIGTFEWTVRIRFLRLMAQYNDDLSGRVNPLIIVVMQLGSGNAVAHEDKWSVETRRVRESDRYEIVIDFELVPVELQLIVGSKGRAGCQLKLLEIGVVVAHRTKTQGPELRSNVIRCLI